MPMVVTPGPLAGLFLVDLEVRPDAERPGASFREVFRDETLRAAGVPPFPPAGVFPAALGVGPAAERPGASSREVFRGEAPRAAGVPPFTPVQWNVSESAAGTLRGFHAESWNKLVHVAAGRVFAAIAD